MLMLELGPTETIADSAATPKPNSSAKPGAAMSKARLAGMTKRVARKNALKLGRVVRASPARVEMQRVMVNPLRNGAANSWPKCRKKEVFVGRDFKCASSRPAAQGPIVQISDSRKRHAVLRNGLPGHLSQRATIRAGGVAVCVDLHTQSSQVRNNIGELRNKVADIAGCRLIFRTFIANLEKIPRWVLSAARFAAQNRTLWRRRTQSLT